MRMRNWVLGLALVVVAVGAFYRADLNPMGMLMAKGGAATAAPPPMMAMPVPVVKIVKRTLPITLEYSARMESIGIVTLQSKISGFLRKQEATDGADVKKGALLYTIDPREFQDALDQANAQLERDSANLDYVRSNYNRGADLAKSGFIAKDAIDQRGSNMRQAEAALSIDKALIQVAQLNLSYAEIRAPFAGRLGRNQAPDGTLVGAGATILNTLAQLDPIYVTFNPSESDLVAIEQARQRGPVDVDVFLPGQTKPVRNGHLTFIDNTVDRSTGTITARATIENGDFQLLPGQFVRVEVHIGERPDALMAPQIALGSSQLGKYLYLVGEGNHVDKRLVTTGPTDGALVNVIGPVAEGDQVIVGNLQKIGPGMPVQPLAKPKGS